MSGKSAVDKRITGLYILVGIILIILLTMVFYKPIATYFRKQSIKSNARLLNILEVSLYCEDIMKQDPATKEALNECREGMSKFAYLEERFDEMIDREDDIDCNDFISHSEARQFYEYTGGMNTLNSLDFFTDEEGKYNGYGYEIRARLLREHKDRYDPFNLDANNDGRPCEGLE